MADYFGNLLIEHRTLDHRGAFFKLAVEQIREAQQQHDIQDMIVVVERSPTADVSENRLREAETITEIEPPSRVAFSCASAGNSSAVRRVIKRPISRTARRAICTRRSD
jgi:hypothetical protein